jgi:hypothetical protein
MTRTKKNVTAGIAAALTAVVSVGALPVAASAQSLNDLVAQRQKTKNEWRNLAIGGAAATAYGLLKGDKTVTILGAAGALYSLNRYEQDRKSQDKASRERAAFYSRPYYYQNGKRYDRKVVTRNGQRYYQYVRR